MEDAKGREKGSGSVDGRTVSSKILGGIAGRMVGVYLEGEFIHV